MSGEGEGNGGEDFGAQIVKRGIIENEASRHIERIWRYTIKKR